MMIYHGISHYTTHYYLVKSYDNFDHQYYDNYLVNSYNVVSDGTLF